MNSLSIYDPASSDGGPYIRDQFGRTVASVASIALARQFVEVPAMVAALQEVMKCPDAALALRRMDNVSGSAVYDGIRAILARIGGTSTAQPAGPTGEAGQVAKGDAIALLETAVEAWGDDIDGDEPIAGSDAVEWLCGFIADARAVLGLPSGEPIGREG